MFLPSRVGWIAAATEVWVWAARWLLRLVAAALIIRHNFLKVVVLKVVVVVGLRVCDFPALGNSSIGNVLPCQDYTKLDTLNREATAPSYRCCLHIVLAIAAHVWRPFLDTVPVIGEWYTTFTSSLGWTVAVGCYRQWGSSCYSFLWTDSGNYQRVVAETIVLPELDYSEESYIRWFWTSCSI